MLGSDYPIFSGTAPDALLEEAGLDAAAQEQLARGTAQGIIDRLA